MKVTFTEVEKKKISFWLEQHRQPKHKELWHIFVEDGYRKAIDELLASLEQEENKK